jgi:hypothetical protein
MPETGWAVPKNHASGPQASEQAVADILHHHSLTSTFGEHGEWEVRTTFVADRKAWRYQSSVFLQGSERKKSFPRIDIDRTRNIKRTGTVTEELLMSFAKEAVEVHIARCESVQEYLTMAPFFSQVRPGYARTKRVAVALVCVVGLVTAYWWWKDFSGLPTAPPGRQPPPYTLQWQPLQISHQYPAGEPFEFPLPQLERKPEGIPVDVALEASGDQPSWLQLDRDQLRMRGTAPLTAANQTYRLSVRAQAAPGRDSRLVVLLTITGPPEQNAPVRPLPGHWAW